MRTKLYIELEHLTKPSKIRLFTRSSRWDSGGNKLEAVFFKSKNFGPEQLGLGRRGPTDSDIFYDRESFRVWNPTVQTRFVIGPAEPVDPVGPPGLV